MNDITELAQSLKAAAEKWQEAWGKYDKVEITIAEFIRAANQYESIVKDPANILALVEALEEAQKRNGELETYSKTALEFREAARDENRHLKLELEIAEKRIGELESRAVTVKLPKPHAHLIWIQAGHAPDDYWDDVVVSHSEKDRCCDGSERYPVYARWEIEEMLTAEGIKWEAE
ncbi:hypothetical protein ACU62I_24625 [Klebsiella aerogenes]